ncbi:MAG: nitroreductase family deazaflavin-dependent oxidoreductase [Caldilineaceae bacterium]
MKKVFCNGIKPVETIDRGKTMNLYHKLIDRLIRTDVGRWMILHLFCPLDQRLMRWTSGAVSSSLGTAFHNHSILLYCTGAKSGQPREIPLLATPLEKQFILIASAIGQAKNPAWYYNLKAHPNCALLVPNLGKIACVAHEAEGDERAHAWRMANAQFSGYTTYQTKTKRRIPVMILDPISPGA